jgi:hypothetical protein
MNRSLILLVFFLVIISCNEKNGPSPKIGGELKVAEYYPYSIAQISLTNVLDGSTYVGQVGEEKIELNYIEEDTSLVFLVPDIAKGTYNVEIEDLDHPLIEITVLEKKNIGEPTKYVDDFYKEIEQQVERFNTINKDLNGVNHPQSVFINQAIQQAKTELTALDESELNQLAYFLAANRTTLPDLSDYEVIDSLRFKTTISNPPDEFKRRAAAFATMVGASVIQGGMLAGLVYAKDISFISAKVKGVMVLTLVASTTASVTLASTLAKDLLDIGGIPTLLEEVKGLALKKDLEFESGKAYELRPTVKFRQIGVSDVNHPLSFVAKAVGDIYTLQEVLNSINSAIKTLADFLDISTYEKIDIVSGLEDEPKTGYLSVSPDNLILENITNDVEGEYWVEDNKLAVKFESVEDKDFKFDVVYSNTDGQEYLRKTIDAEVKAELSVQEMLLNGVKPSELLKQGYPKDSLYWKFFEFKVLGKDSPNIASGFIFHMNSTATECKLSSMSNMHRINHQWAKSTNKTGYDWKKRVGTSTAFGSGSSNTEKIIQTHKDNDNDRLTAAQGVKRRFYPQGIYYLPSKDEVEEIVKIYSQFRIYGWGVYRHFSLGEEDKRIWTSSEDPQDNEKAWSYHLKTNTFGTTQKYQYIRIWGVVDYKE